MTEIDYIEQYKQRLANPECYVTWRGPAAAMVNDSLHDLGYTDVDPKQSEAVVAHGLLVMGKFTGSRAVSCIPWLVAPDAPWRDKIGGRHGFVFQEFQNDFAEPHGFKQSRKLGMHGLGTYGVKVGDENLGIIPWLSDIQSAEKRLQAIELVMDVSTRLDAVKFCLRHSYSEWVVVQGGEAAVRAVPLPTMSLPPIE